MTATKTISRAARDSYLVGADIWLAGNELDAVWVSYFSAMVGGA